MWFCMGLSSHDTYLLARRGGESIDQPCRNFGIKRGWWLAPRPGLFTPVKDQTPIVHECEWTSGKDEAGHKKARPYRSFIPRPSSMYRVAVMTTLSWAPIYGMKVRIVFIMILVTSLTFFDFYSTFRAQQEVKTRMDVRHDKLRRRQWTIT
jgi:hypothetical protein